jgi:hypothetical protein
MYRLMPFFIQLGVFSLLLLAVFLISEKYFPSQFAFEYTPMLIAWYFMLTAITHVILYRQGNVVAKFIRWFMGTITIRFLIHLVVMFFWAFTYRETALAFIITYFVLYLCYLLFEVLWLMRIQRQMAQSNKQQ